MASSNPLYYQHQPLTAQPQNFTSSSSMLPSSYQPLHPIMDTLLQDIYSKLSKLDTLDVIVSMLNAIEGKFVCMESSKKGIKQELKVHSDKLERSDFDHAILEERLSKVENERDRAQEECEYRREKIIELQARSMKDNLLLSGIPETNQPEDSEAVIKDVIKSELGVEDDMHFQVVHRLRRRSDGKPRSIVAKFTYRKERDIVSNAATAKLAGKPQFSVNEQYPPEVNDRRRLLYPVLKEARRRGQTARMKVDKLYIDGVLYNLPPRNSARMDGSGHPHHDHSRSQDQGWSGQTSGRNFHDEPQAPTGGYQRHSQSATPMDRMHATVPTTIRRKTLREVKSMTKTLLERTI